MAVLLTSVSQGTNELIAAQAGRIIRVLRMVAEPNAELYLKSASSAISPYFKTGSNAHLDVAFAAGDLVTARGEALNATSAAVGSQVVWIKYDVVD